MLERIQLINNIGNYFQVNAGSIQFQPVNIIYGENRNGKSTLCDIFYSLALNNPQLILDRKSIIANQAPSEINQIIKMKFSGQSRAIQFQNNNWDSIPPDDSRLYIFDHGFIHRNVMTGVNYTRENSTNMSGFILGENATQFEALELRNQKLRNDRRDLTGIKSQINAHSVGNVDTFVSMPLTEKTAEELDLVLQASKEKQTTLNTQISNIDHVIRRPILNDISTIQAIKDNLLSINKCLSLNIENVHEVSRAIVDGHKNKVANTNLFNGWASNGLKHLRDDCPFCGQDLKESAQVLIDSYKTAFDTTFQSFLSEISTQISSLLKINLVDSNFGSVKEQHQRNLNLLENTYIESEVQSRIHAENFIEQLAQKFERLEYVFSELEQTNSEFDVVIRTSLEQKSQTPYNSINTIDFTNLEAKFNEYCLLVGEYNCIKSDVNHILNQFKESQDVTLLKGHLNEEARNEEALIKFKKRHDLDSLCTSYINLKAQIESDQASYDTDKTALENAQNEFLDTYFVEINTLFRRIGSSDFEISKSINRIGTRTVYDLEVTFKGCPIDRNKLHCLFSESDRRALALCIFLAKIHQLPPVDREKAILVLDDPVTSFDNERISSILRILYTLNNSIKQLIITTHYKGMASAVMKKFSDAQALKIVQSENGSMLAKATKEEMTATAHDERYMEIIDFIERRTMDNKFTKLRPFIEDEMRQRYRLSLSKIGLNDRTSFNDCIEGLKNHHYISSTVAESLHEFRTTLNLPAHELELWTVDDSRTYAEQMMDFIYCEL
ncbi:AAA family ATPase [Acinetobacter sp. SFA]|uniref:AAA family ATPase n=1 Tax=Acinetobacter sp. SFA TaxID=1805633 RepID=UPI0007D07FFB|nr:AAA family ATPase [Acinetobacter sp. SFA]OAL80709.1 hypothetical protein AY607_03190 [Acinetobacter sp. SFA]